MSHVSVIMPCRNAERFVGDALRSILAQPGVLEIIVVDDGSSDRSVAVAQGLNDARVRIVPGPQRGIAAAFNAGLAAAQGRVITRCDADDAYPADRLVWQVEWLDAHPDAVAVCGSFLTVDSDGDELAQFEFAREEEDITEELLTGRARTHFCTFACRAETLRSIGGCREWFRTAEDVDLQFRLAEAGRVAFVPRLAYRYRIHDQSITHQQQDVQREFYWQAARQFALDRRDGGRDALQRDEAPTPPEGGGRSAAHDHSQDLLLGHAWRQHAGGLRWRSVVTGLRAVAAAPGNFEAWRSVAALVVRSLCPRPAAPGGRTH